MKKPITIFMSILFFAVASSIIYYGCKKKDSASCSDGIQNQGETGVDCGGPCKACAAATSVLCNGNGTASYFPLVAKNYWHYTITNASYDQYDTITGTTVYSSNTYFTMHSYDYTDGYSYYRISAGAVYSYYTNLSAEYMLIPASPTVNQSWAYPAASGIGTRKVISINASVSTAGCAYTSCLEIQEFDSSSNPADIYYYKQGIGMVNKVSSITTYNLVQITLH